MNKVLMGSEVSEGVGTGLRTDAALLANTLPLLANLQHVKQPALTRLSQLVHVRQPHTRLCPFS